MTPFEAGTSPSGFPSRGNDAGEIVGGPPFSGLERILLLSTSTLHGGEYLAYAQEVIREHLRGVERLTFIPFARPSLVSHDEYTRRASAFFSGMGINVAGLHEAPDPKAAIEQADAVFTGGGNTFVLLKSLRDLNLLHVLRRRIAEGMPYMGSSAGTNIAGLSIGTTNDMPVVWPDSLEAVAAVPFNINPHYLDPSPDSTHMGETRETRIREFHGYNPQPVVGLREGSWLRVADGRLELGGPHTARVFRRGEEPEEVGSAALPQLLWL